MKKDIKFSVIIPMYNAQKYIRKTLKSVLNQTYINYEVIIINDGSTDNSLSICEEFKKADKRIIIHNKSNEGLAKARFDGINLANSDYIVFLDSDDWVVSTMLEVFYKNILESGADILQASFNSKYRFLSKKQIKNNCEFEANELREKYLADLLGAGNVDTPLFIYACGKAYKTDVLKRNMIFHKKFLPFAEDVYMNLIVYSDKNLGKIKILENRLWYYRKGVGLSSKQDTYRWIDNYLLKNDALTDFLIDVDAYTDEIIFKAHLEIVYIAVNVFLNEYDESKDESIVFKKISEYFSNPLWVKTQSYFKNICTQLDEETKVFAYSSPEQYMEHIKLMQSQITNIKRIKSKCSKIIRNIV